VAHSGDGGPARRAHFNLPSSIAFDRADIYVADSANNVIRRVHEGIVTTVKTTNLSYPRDIAIDATRHLYINDSFHHRVLRMALPPT
jgi:hypothetical protein